MIIVIKLEQKIFYKKTKYIEYLYINLMSYSFKYLKLPQQYPKILKIFKYSKFFFIIFIQKDL